MSAGKGDKARNCHTQQFRDNHDAIDWGKGKQKQGEKVLDAANLPKPGELVDIEVDGIPHVFSWSINREH